MSVFLYAAAALCAAVTTWMLIDFIKWVAKVCCSLYSAHIDTNRRDE